jgi:hypothetical protein
MGLGATCICILLRNTYFFFKYYHFLAPSEEGQLCA